MTVFNYNLQPLYKLLFQSGMHFCSSLTGEYKWITFYILEKVNVMNGPCTIYLFSNIASLLKKVLIPVLSVILVPKANVLIPVDATVVFWFVEILK